MDARLREATSAEILTAVAKLFRALPPRRANPEELLESYEIACHKATKHAIETVVLKLIRGELSGLSKSFAPSPAELSSAIRDEMAFVRKQIEIGEERSLLADHRPVAIRAPNYEERQGMLREQMAEERRALLFTVTSHDDYLRKRKHLPIGSVYHALLGEAYGPPGWVPPVEPEKPEPDVLDVEPEPQPMDVDW